MRNKITTALASAGVAAALIGTGLVTAGPAQAAYGCTNSISMQVQLACETAFKRASMTPLTAQAVVQYQADWCQIKRARGTSEAYRLLNNRVGATKGNAIGYGADYWLC